MTTPWTCPTETPAWAATIALARLWSRRVSAGSLSVGGGVTLSVDYARRAPIAKNHTTTHMLNFALKGALGTACEQRGVRALLHDPAVREHHDVVGVARARDLVRREEHGALAGRGTATPTSIAHSVSLFSVIPDFL